MPRTREEIQESRRLIAEYPFIAPWYFRDGETFPPPQDTGESYVPSFLDDMPDGWRENFGEQLCKELKEAIVKAGKLDTYSILQVKEKYGELRWYDTGGTAETCAIKQKYIDLSSHTCIMCGKPAKYITTGWIEPYCEDCLPKSDREHGWYKETSDMLEEEE